MSGKPVQPLTAACRQVVTMRMRDSLLTKLRLEAAQVPQMVETHTSVCAMLMGTPGKTLRMILERYRVQLKTTDVLWGWVAQESTEEWLQLTGGRPQRDKGKPLMGVEGPGCGSRRVGRHADQQRYRGLQHSG